MINPLSKIDDFIKMINSFSKTYVLQKIKFANRKKKGIKSEK